MGSILHISDIHFGPPHLPKVAAGVRALVQDRKPDLVAVSGDLTQRAKPQQFRAARSFLDGLEAPYLAVPGNHDVPLYRVWERLLCPFRAYRVHFGRELEPILADHAMLVAGFCTAHNWTFKNGRLRRSQLRRAAAVFAGGGARLKVAVLHHPLIVVPGFEREPATRRARRALEVFAQVGVELVLSGHLHQLHLARAADHHPDLAPIPLLLAGTTTSDRGRHREVGVNTGNWVEWDRDRLRVRHLRFCSASGRFEDVEPEHRIARQPL